MNFTNQIEEGYLTSKPKKLSSVADVMIGLGSNHSGELPSRFFNVFAEQRDKAPVPRANITALSDHHFASTKLYAVKNSEKTPFAYIYKCVTQIHLKLLDGTNRD